MVNRQLYFWLFLAGPEGSLDDLIIWYVIQYYDTGFHFW
jgi:hypothetical protein